MAKITTRKPTTSRRKSKKSKSFFSVKFIIISVLLLGLCFGIYHYRDAILYYFSFKTDKVLKQNKIDGARIYQVLKKHDDKVIGFDVSEYQGEIEWERVDSLENRKLHFVFIRATAGSDKVDAKFKSNWAKAKENQFICGAYHYYRPNENSIEQAKNFVKTVRLRKGDLPPVLDIEQLPESQSIDSLKVGLKRWLDYVDKHYKVKPILYSGESYYEDFLKDEFEGYTFWIANYNPWKETMDDEWDFWQFSEKGVVKGINEKVDINIYNGTPKMLKYATISN
jgi:lysozyme